MNEHPAESHTGVRRVLFPFVGDTVGGSHISALELAGGLDPVRFKLIVAVHREGLLRSYLEGRGMAALKVPDLMPSPLSGSLRQDGPATILAIPRLARFLRRLRIDIVHTHDARMHFLWGPVAKLARAKFVLHRRAVVQSRINFSSRFADSILAISESCRDQFPPGTAARVHVVLNPFRPPCSMEDPDLWRRRILDEAGRTAQATAIVGYVSNLMDRKRPLMFVETAARLRDRLGDTSFFPMFGDTDGVRDETLKHEITGKIAEHDLASQCVLMGPRFPIEPWIMGCDVLVAPAVNEPFGRTLVEAMLCGTPVVAADDGGHKEIIRHGETGLLARADDPEAFADAVVVLIEKPRMAKAIAQKAKAHALATYSVEAHVDRIQSIYGSLSQ